jgi:hypothetical protein
MKRTPPRTLLGMSARLADFGFRLLVLGSWLPASGSCLLVATNIFLF